MNHRPEESSERTGQVGNDGLGHYLLQAARYLVVVMVAILPFFFTPGLWASLDFDKAFLALTLSLVAVILICFLGLRKARVKTVLPLSIGLLWMVAFAAFASGVISGDVQDGLRGNMVETQTALFLSIMALIATITLVLQNSKEMSIRALTGFAVVSLLLLVFVSLRLVFGAEFLSFQTFTTITATPIGSFNDLAIFAGLITVLSLITLTQLPLRGGVGVVLSASIGFSLFILSVVNFFNIWVVVGAFSLIMLMYLLARDTLFRGEERSVVSQPRLLLAMTTLVCLVSIVFIVAGDRLGQKMGQLTDVNYVEVRPSIEATIGIARRVYHENTLFGIGANRFADAWRLHKDPTINETIFWDTDFVAGSGFVPTVFVNLGLLGGVLLVVFHLGLLYAGYRILLRTTKRDPYWYYVGTIAFAAALFLWGVSYVYVPGAGILLIASFFTGLTFVAMASLLPDSVKTVPLVVNRQRGFLQMAVVLLVLVASVSGTYSVGKQYLAESQFNKARATSTSVEDLEKTALASYELYPDERFLSAQAQIHLATLSSLLGVAEPTEEQLKAFGHAAKLAVTAAEAAVSRDFTDPDHHAVLAGVFTNLTAAGVEAARSRATESLAEAERLDPLNPGYALLKAQIAARSGNVEAARAAIAEALAMKRNFTQAMYLSAQLDISEGKTESAIETTRSIITLEPNNPTRYFQLGVLLSATNNVAESVAAYRAAIALDPQYANARYLLALAQLSTGEAEAALAQLRTVRETNQGNQALEDLIKQVESGQYQVPETTAFEVPVSERTPAEQGSDVVGEDDVESGLVTPVNTIPESAEVAEPPAVTEFESVEQNGLPAPTSSSEVLPPTP